MTRLAFLFCLASTACFVVACGDNNDNSSKHQCSDGVDNDGDGLIDFPDDPGCADANDDSEDTAGPPQCSDGIDNDGDGKIDFPDDPGCTSPNQDSETDDCPDGPGCPECSNGLDDDGNHLIDYPDDPGCASASDTKESSDDPQACGMSLVIKDLPASHEDTFPLDPMSTMVTRSPCGGGNGVPAIAYRFHTSHAIVITASTDDPLTTVDNTIVDIRGSMCTDMTSEVACNDNITSTNLLSTATAGVVAGTYYIIVEGQNTMVSGMVHLQVELSSGQGVACTGQQDCGTGLVCRVALGDTALTCQLPMCSDGVDDDGDGKLDFPDDPGCTGPDDNDETDDCPSGPNCPKCANGIDDDGDGLIDYPADPGCSSAATNTESCDGERDPILAITSPTTLGTLVGAHDDQNPTCTTQTGGVDVLLAVTVPALTSLHVDDLGSTVSDTTMSLLPSTCGSPVIACDDDTGSSLLSSIDTGPLAAGTYIVAVDAYNGAVTPAAFKVNFSGQLTPGESCDPANTMGGALVCPTGTMCADDPDSPGSLICLGPPCNDGRDNDGDGKIDYPDDPGCSSPDDTDETDDCPNGPNCPACANGIDDDGDGLIDFPADPSCTSASGGSESCNGERDPILSIVGPVTNGTLVGAHDDKTPTCSFAGGPDVMLTVNLPALSTLHLDTNGSAISDTVLSVMGATCAGPDIACDDDSGDGFLSSLDIAGVAAGSYVIAVDAFSSSTPLDTFKLNLLGTFASGGSCENTLGGALVCPTGTACMGTVGSRHCLGAFACNDGVDNDGDGKIDYPNDPGCASPTDNDETDDCPSGPNCPACSNGLDDDGDGHIDYPADPGCKAASTLTESCDAERDPIFQITGPTTTGNLSGAHDDHTPPTTCTFGTGGVDEMLILTVPALASLHVDTNGSTITDTVVSLLPGATCAEPDLACNDNESTSNDLSAIDLIALSAGTYVVVVEVPYSFSTVGPFTLNVSGQLAAGAACDAAHNLGGALTCVIGTSCMAGTCQP
jgi:large repetitive protein